MLLSWNVVVSECPCVRMPLCRNGDMSGYVLSGYVFYGNKYSDNHMKTGGRLVVVFIALLKSKKS